MAKSARNFHASALWPDACSQMEDYWPLTIETTGLLVRVQIQQVHVAEPLVAGRVASMHQQALRSFTGCKPAPGRRRH